MNSKEVLEEIKTLYLILEEIKNEYTRLSKLEDLNQLDRGKLSAYEHLLNYYYSF